MSRLPVRCFLKLGTSGPITLCCAKELSERRFSFECAIRPVLGVPDTENLKVRPKLLPSDVDKFEWCERVR
ncbi:hypothetical protein GCM10026988_02260 [Vibrio panuliri]